MTNQLTRVVQIQFNADPIQFVLRDIAYKLQIYRPLKSSQLLVYLAHQQVALRQALELQILHQLQLVLVLSLLPPPL